MAFHTTSLSMCPRFVGASIAAMGCSVPITKNSSLFWHSWDPLSRFQGLRNLHSPHGNTCCSSTHTFTSCCVIVHCQAAPNLSSGRSESFRHALAVSTYRPGLDGTPYVYTFNLACPDENWDDLEPVFTEAMESFRLTETTNAYIPPDKDPWLFF